jgi:7-cyano-7-deazaguanine synthase
MLSIAASWAETSKATSVLTAIVAVDNISGYYDCTPEFITALNNTLALNRLHRIEIKSPLVSLSKAEIIKKGIELGADFSQTWTCYSPVNINVDPDAIYSAANPNIYSTISCGECPSCSARLKGFIDAGYIDPLPYAVNIDWQKYNCVSI